jgi:hypothetical protein
MVIKIGNTLSSPRKEVCLMKVAGIGDIVLSRRRRTRY